MIVEDVFNFYLRNELLDEKSVDEKNMSIDLYNFNTEFNYNI